MCLVFGVDQTSELLTVDNLSDKPILI